MNAKDIFLNLQKLIEKENIEEVKEDIVEEVKLEEEIKLAYAKLEDGTILKSDSFEIDDTIEKVIEDGTVEPIEDGEYVIEYEDVNFTIKVEGGKITDKVPYVEPEEEEEVVPVEEPLEEVNLEEKIITLEQRISALEELLKKKEDEDVVMEEEKLEEEVLPKLDGAPIEEKLSKVDNIFKNRKKTTQELVLEKLYKQ